MNLARRLVLVAGSVGLVASCAIAQSQAIRPQYYSWEKHPVLESDPGDPDFFEYDGRFCAMVRVYIDSGMPNATSAQQAAIATKNEILTRMSEGTGTIDLQNLAITIHNLGGFTGGQVPLAYQDVNFSFLRASDAAPTFLGFNSEDPPLYRQYQPWMGTAVGEYRLNEQTQEMEWREGDVYDWVKAYCDHLKIQLASAELDCAPIRFHFDFEGNLFGESWNSAIVRQMIACERDYRWDSAEVPGFDGQTMEQLWHAAQNEYGWTNQGMYVTLESVLFPSFDAHVEANNPYATWWLKITGQALNAAFKRCVQDPIKASWPNAEVLVSNYGHTNADMAVDTFGYRKVTDPGAQTLSQYQQTLNRIDSNVFFRGVYSQDDRGAYPRYVALSSTGGPPLMFQMGGGQNLLDFDAPVLYYPNGSGPAGKIAQYQLQDRLYEPRDSNDDPVLETVAQSVERTHRHNLESIINTPTRAENGVTPWIEFPGVHWIDTSATLSGIEQTRRQLALFRSKDIREVILWSNKQGPGQRGTPSAWNAVKRADAQVFTSSYVQYYVTAGSDETPNINPGDPTPLSNTLRNATPTIDITSQQLDSNYDLTEIVVVIDDIYPEELGHNGRLLLECQVEPVDPDELTDAEAWQAGITGKIFIWRPGSADWAPLDSVNDAGNKGDYHFYVPDNSTRREWPVGWDPSPDPLCEYLDESCQGAMAIKFVHIAPATTSGFVSKYDLVQFYQVDDIAQWSSSVLSGFSEEPYLSADFNYDGVQDSTDADLFTAAWTNNERRADYNGDGVVNSTDLAQFLAASARTSSGGGSSEW